MAEDARDMLVGAQVLRWREDGAATPVRERQLRQRLGIDLSPLIDETLHFFRRHGVPLRAQRDEDGGGPVGVMAAFSVGDGSLPVSVHLGDRPLEPIGAFYAPERGFRCAVVWPLDRFTLRLEGGEDSAFGYYGIAGVQWVHPTRPLAVGVGVPLNLRDADGGVGVILQLRLRLD